MIGFASGHLNTTQTLSEKSKNGTNLETMMSEIKNIHQRLAEAMKAVKYIQKEQKKGMQYSIVSHDAVTAKVRPALLDAGIVYYPEHLTHEQNGNRTEVGLSVRFVNIDNPEDYFSVPAIGYGIDQQDKGPGKAISYAVKYALLKALGLETGDDPDQDQNVEHEPEPTEAEQRKALHDKTLAANWDSVQAIKESIASENYSAGAEAWFEMDDDTKQALWLAPSKGGIFTTREREIMKTTEFKQAYYGEAA